MNKQQTEFQITMIRSPRLSDDECRRRLQQAFNIILDFSFKTETTANDSVSQAGTLAADEALPQETELTEFTADGHK